MKDKQLEDLIQSGQWESLETYWNESLQSGETPFEDYLEAARLLGRQREKARAAALMTILEEHLREKQNWPKRLRVLKEMLRHTPDLKKFDDLRDQIFDTLQLVYPGRPSYQAILKHHNVLDIRDPEGLSNALDKAGEWLRMDVGQLFYQQGYGVGRISEINMRLNVARIDFEKKKDVTVEVGDTDLISLQPGHILHEKMEQPEEFRSKAEKSPAEMLGRLLQTMGRSLTVSEIKECLSSGLPYDWSRWWNAAKKHPQVIMKGKGAQADYSWSDTASEAEDALRREFDAADPWKQLALGKTHAGRGGELADHFRNALIEDAQAARAERKWDLALEILEVLAKWPGGAVDPGFTFDQLLGEAEPQKLLAALENTLLKMKILAAYPQVKPEAWKLIFSDRFLREDNPKAIAFIFQQIKDADQDASEALLNRVFASLHAYPPLFTWLIEYFAVENFDRSADPLGHRLDGRFFMEAIDAIDSQGFSVYRNRIKKAIESGLLMNLLSESVDPEIAMKIVEKLEHTRHVEDYRRERWRNFIRAKIPSTKKKEEYIFSTPEAFERKRAELEQLIKVELPTNRKAVGEAAAHGDLKENHEYKAARERQEYLINRVQILQNELHRVRLLEPGSADCSEVRPGTRVHLTQSPEKHMVLTLLGPWDSDPKEGVYSYQAPIGVLLVGKTPGEKIVWNDEHWVVEKIEPWS